MDSCSVVQEMNVLTAKELLNLFASPTFQNLLQLIQKPLLDKIERIEEKNNEILQRLKQLENTTQNLSEKIKNQVVSVTSSNNHTGSIHTQMQTEKRQNLIVTGLPEENEENLKRKITQLFHEKFEKQEIAFDCERLGKKTENHDTSTPAKPRPIKIKFNNIWDKRNIYMNRIKKLQNSGIFINEDLMQDKAKLAYEARILRRKRIIHSVFTQDGNVYFRRTQESEATEFNEEIFNVLQNDQQNQETYIS